MDIFTLIGRSGLGCHAVTKKLKTNFRATEMFLNALVSLRVLRKTKEIYKNTEMSNRYLVRSSITYQGDRIHHFHNMCDYWSGLDISVKTGRPVAFDNAKQDVDEQRLREFIKAMHNIATVQAGEVCRKLQIKKFNKLLDLGGGQGTYAVRFVEKNPDMRAVVFDLPEVIKISRKYINKSGMKEKITTRSGDCLRDDYGRELYDIVFISNLLHIYEPLENRKILKKCWDSLLKNGIVVVQEFVLNPTKTQPVFSALFSLNMLMGTRGGSSYSANEMNEWLKEAGFKNIKKLDLGMDSGLIIGSKL